MAEEAKAGSASESSASDFLEALYGDPLKAATTRAGNYLIIFSALCAAAALFKVRLQPSGLLPINFGERDDVLAMLLAAAVLLLLLSFMARGLTDLLRDRETHLLVTRYVEKARVDAANAAARATEDDIAQSEYEHRNDDGPSEPDPWWEGAIEVSEQAAKAVTAAELRLGMRRSPRWLRCVRLWAELTIPLAFGLIALALSKAHLYAFATVLFEALWV